MPPTLYAAFDRFPAPKGAAVHIAHTVKALFAHYGDGLLFVLGGPGLPAYQREPEGEIVRFMPAEPNLLRRALRFGAALGELLEQRGATLRLCQFRDPWSGLPILMHPNRHYRTVYEVNGLPSIELPMLYGTLDPRTLAKIRAAEQFCLEQADALLTPAETIRTHLLGRGIPPAKIMVVPNGANLRDQPLRPPEAPPRYLLYSGALQPWQGLDTLLRALALLADLEDLALVVCASTPRRTLVLQRLAARLGIAERIHWRFELGQDELAAWLAGAAIAVAPLSECSRNLDQGCCPLKILEAMAAGVPVIAADLPAVRELVTDGVEGRLVRPDRPAELARAIRVLLEYPECMAAMGRSGRERIAAGLTWQHNAARLEEFYRTVDGGRWTVDGGRWVT